MTVREMITLLNELLMKLKADPESKILVEYLDGCGGYCSADINKDNIIVRDDSVVFDIVEVMK